MYPLSFETKNWFKKSETFTCVQNFRLHDLAKLTTVWGTLLSQISTPVTLLQSKGAHLQFCKRYFEVHNKALNMASRSELGKYPMIIDTSTKILNSLSFYKLKMPDNSIVKQSLQISIELYNSGQNSFY